MATPRFVRYFTPREANDMLPEVLDPVREAARLAERYRQLAELLKAHDLSPGRYARAAAEAEELRNTVMRRIASVGERGVEVKGLDVLLLDFPALRDGREVYLCWRDGEVMVSWWHPLETGFRGRERVEDPDDGRWEWCH